MKKVFLDANIILDFLDTERKLHLTAKSLFRALVDLNSRIVISEDLLTTIYYVTSNKSAVLAWFEVILNEWEIVSFGKKVIAEAVNLCKEDNTIDFEDVLQSLSAKKAECDLIISNDKNFYNCGIQMISASDFLEQTGTGSVRY